VAEDICIQAFGVKREMKTRLAGFLMAGMLACSVSFAAGGSLESARKLYDRTNYKEAISVLEPLASASPADANIHFWIGKSYFMLGQYKRAGEAFEKATQLDSSNSEYFDWLGKAYGRRAETSGPLTAPGYASKARQNFEAAVRLNPKNIEAVNDLFEYYKEAPGFLGGGLDKASELTGKIKAVDPVEYQWALAQIAVKRKEYKTAEEHFRQAMDLAPRQVGRILDLARFLSKQGRIQESDEILAKAEKVAPNEPRVVFERASNLIRAKKNLDTAKALLEKYMKLPLTPDDPSREEAQKLLKTVAGA
jgi:tetratricopeptide (TPR) repeat protein